MVVAVLDRATPDDVTAVRQRDHILENATGNIAIAVVMAVSEDTVAAAARRGTRQPWLTTRHSENWHDQRGRWENEVPLISLPG